MIIRFSRHAKVRMKERHISRTMVENALLKFSKITPIEDDKFIYYYEIDGEMLVVVAIKQRDRYTIVTAYYENNIR